MIEVMGGLLVGLKEMGRFVKTDVMIYLLEEMRQKC